MSHMTGEPISDKWYICRGWSAGRYPTQGSGAEIDAFKKAQIDHNKPQREMRIAGPFDSKEQAEEARNSRPDSHDIYAWQAPAATPPAWLPAPVPVHDS